MTLPSRWEALRDRVEIQNIGRKCHTWLASYLGCCWLANDDPAWALLVLMGNRSIGCPLIQEPLGCVDTTVLDAGFLFKLLTYPVTIVEIAPAGFICRRDTGGGEQGDILVLWSQPSVAAVELDQKNHQHC